MKVSQHRQSMGAAPCTVLNSRPSRLLVLARGILFATLVTGASGAEAALMGSVLYQINNPSGLNVGPTLNGAAAGQVVGYSSTGLVNRAVLWPASGVPVKLNPAGSTNSIAYATDGTWQVGTENSGTAQEHAVLWNGTAASVVDLHPSGYTGSEALGGGGIQQVGYATIPNGLGYLSHAILWNGSAASAVDLHPAGFGGSFAEDTDGTRQVGYGFAPVSGNQHALLWTGTAASAVDLNPSGFNFSFAYGVGGGQQVGYGTSPALGTGALLWNGTAASAVFLLGPTGFQSTYAYGTNGIQQVGYGHFVGVGQVHAIVWSGTTASAVDLHALLPAGFGFTDSEAYSVDASGNIFGSAATVNGYYAVEWSPVPEPASMTLIAVGALTIGIGATLRLSACRRERQSRRISDS